MFTLANGTTQSIFYRGAPDPALGKVKMTCDFANEAVAYSQRVFEPALEDKVIEVKSGERLHLNLSASLPLDLKHHNSKCQLI
jgi:hypothetical protein